MAMPTLIDVVRRNGTDAAVGLIDETTKAVPEVRIGAARTIKGLNYKTRVRTGLPTVGFRQVNQGTAVYQSQTEQRLIEAYLMNPQFEVDKAAADAAEDGAAAYLAEEAQAITQAAMQTLGVAFFYGAVATFGKTDAFPGLLQGYDDSNMYVDAGGTTDNVASSVWLVRFGLQDVRWVLGEGGRADVSDPTEVRLTDGSGNPYTGYRQELYLRPGLQVGSVYSVCRIKKLTTDSSKGLTDALFDQAMEKFPAGKPPNAIFMTRRSRRQWKSSRTATSPTGAPAPWPDSVDGPEGVVPVYTTDSISNIETLAL
jgi:hypothetical protein